ncbi:MAG: Uma2 family endonuclease [Fimbriimonadales bacterium]|nr:Uma2 family endonuclease [Fimbriimonadales bacterium]
MATRTVRTAAKSRQRKRREENLPSADSIRQMLAELESLKLPPGDGDRMESDWRVVSISLLDELVRQLLGEPTDYFCGGNMFIYYSIEQAKEIEDYVEAEEVARKPRFKGPDFFLVKGVDGTKPRDSWVVWQEGGRYPDLVVEFISSSTRRKDVDRNVKFYQKVFRTREYFWYDRRTNELKGYRLGEGGQYTEIVPNAQGRLWSEVLGAYLGVWQGKYRGRRYPWLRLYDAQGRLVPTAQEAERQRAEQERQRAEQAEQRVAELEAELRRLRGE